MSKIDIVEFPHAGSKPHAEEAADYVTDLMVAATEVKPGQGVRFFTMLSALGFCGALKEVRSLFWAGALDNGIWQDWKLVKEPDSAEVSGDYVVVRVR